MSIPVSSAGCSKLLPRPQKLPHTLDNDAEPSGDCLLWRWATIKGHGVNFSGEGGRYGVMHTKRKQVMAHRYYYRKHKGDIPEGYVVHHTCYNTLCINPEHLEAVTQSENIRDWRRKR